jgi:hypothetical protein
MVHKGRHTPGLTWLLCGIAIVLSCWAIYAANEGPRSPELERILQENCPGWVC